MARATQEGRLISITTPLGKDHLLVEKIKVNEEISKLFEINVELLYDEEEDDQFQITPMKINQILGQTVSISLTQQDDVQRIYTGMVNQLTQIGRNKRYTFYTATIVPKIWTLTQNTQSRIFQHKRIQDILREVFDGFEIKMEVQADYKPRNYCVQYQETDFDFASRLMEEEGIYYYFEHTNETEKIVLRDDFKKPENCPNKSEIPIYDEDLDADNDWESAIKSIQTSYTLLSGKVTFRDYNFQLTKKTLDSEKSSKFDVGGNQSLETYSFPAGYARKYDGIDKSGGEQPANLNNIFPDIERTAQNRISALDAQHKVLNGLSDCCSLTPGYRFQLKNHPNKEFNIQYIVTSVKHEADQVPSYASDEKEPNAYYNEFTCIPHGAGQPEFRSPLTTPKPIMYGSQTAMVVGVAGEEISTDKYGRVKVKFHWDRDKAHDLDSSCWVRVAREIAGNKWGSMHIPRIGQEVIVDFIEGDPDQPIITGSVYNPETMPHYDLPKYKTLTYFKTRTSPDDGKGFNELRFEDKAGKEQVFMRSQLRMDVRVRGSYYKTVGGNRQEVIGVRADNQPGGNLAITVGGNYDLHVKADHYIGIDGKLNETVKGAVVEDYQSNLYTQVKSKAELNAQSITLEALTKITLKVGGSFITVDLSGVTISGPMVKINSGGAGQGTSPSPIDDPLDAETSDTGEPGYLDRPRSGGGRTRNRRTLNGQHAPPFATTTLPNGDIQVGNGLVIKNDPSDPNFQNKVMEDLTLMSNQPTGMNTLNSLNNSGQTTTIQRRATGGNSYSPNNVADGMPPGTSGNFGSGTVNGTGNGTGGTVNYNPDNPSTNAIRPRDVGLHHELSHADHAANGNYDITTPDPSQPNNPHKEETNTINTDNDYRKDRGVHTRKDHTEL